MKHQGRDRQRNRGLFSGMLMDVSRPLPCPSTGSDACVRFLSLHEPRLPRPRQPRGCSYALICMSMRHHDRWYDTEVWKAA
jgi:hypothetical protein